MSQRTLSVAVLVAAVVLATVAAVPPDDPWTSTQVIAPARLANELSNEPKPRIVCVGFKKLYQIAHVPGAIYLGPGRDAEGIGRLQAWARSVPKNAAVILYCGCCPWTQCPNVRPAFQALKEMGFTRLQVVEMPEDFGKDWVEKGFPIEKGP